jgi:hypothetical protein
MVRFPLLALASWTRMFYEEPTPGGLVPVPVVRAGKIRTAHKRNLMAHGR